jgi:hypothetical protein
MDDQMQQQVLQRQAASFHRTETERYGTGEQRLVVDPEQFTLRLTPSRLTSRRWRVAPTQRSNASQGF